MGEGNLCGIVRHSLHNGILPHIPNPQDCQLDSRSAGPSCYRGRPSTWPEDESQGQEHAALCPAEDNLDRHHKGKAHITLLFTRGTRAILTTSETRDGKRSSKGAAQVRHEPYSDDAIPETRTGHDCLIQRHQGGLDGHGLWQNENRWKGVQDRCNEWLRSRRLSYVGKDCARTIAGAME